MSLTLMRVLLFCSLTRYKWQCQFVRVKKLRSTLQQPALFWLVTMGMSKLKPLAQRVHCYHHRHLHNQKEQPRAIAAK
jgi:hypothetical protein